MFISLTKRICSCIGASISAIRRPNTNDWAEVEYLHLKDGRTVAGTFLRAMPSAFTARRPDGSSIAPGDIANRWKKYYVSFPPFPAVIFLPFVAIFGIAFNDVLLTVVLRGAGALVPLLVLRKLAARGDSQAHASSTTCGSPLMFGSGTVYFYSSVIGSVWYTAHVVATVLTASLRARLVRRALSLSRPDLCIGAIIAYAPACRLVGNLFLYEAWRARHNAASGEIELE